jgi:hypothetical protein
MVDPLQYLKKCGSQGVKKSALLALYVTVGAVGCSQSAQADTISASLSATYYEVLASTGGPDFGGSGSPNVAAGSLLGPNGLPVASNPFGVADVNPVTHEITWWSPSLNSKVIQTGTGIVTLPYGSNMYAPNSTGTNDGTYFETAVFKGAFNLSSAGTVSFKLGSDDDSFIYVDGKLIGQNPGIHGVTNVDFTSGTLLAGAHSIDVFYDDREAVGAYLSLSLNTSGITITPPAPGPAPGTGALSFGFLILAGAMVRARGFLAR